MIEKASGFGIPAAEYEGQDSRMALIFNKTREFAIRNGFSKEKVSTIIESLNRIVAEAEGQEHDGSMPLPGASETLEALKRSGYRIGIVTNTCESELLKMLERFGFKRYIDFHVTRDDVEYLKPHPQPVLKILKQSVQRTSATLEMQTTIWKQRDLPPDSSARIACSFSLTPEAMTKA